MEIETAQAFPLWLCSFLTENKIFPQSFSKYGAEYLKTLENRKPHIVFGLAAQKTPAPLKPAVNA